MIHHTTHLSVCGLFALQENGTGRKTMKEASQRAKTDR